MGPLILLEITDGLLDSESRPDLSRGKGEPHRVNPLLQWPDRHLLDGISLLEEP
jgi:hypothetical protein